MGKKGDAGAPREMEFDNPMADGAPMAQAPVAQAPEPDVQTRTIVDPVTGKTKVQRMKKRKKKKKPPPPIDEPLDATSHVDHAKQFKSNNLEWLQAREVKQAAKNHERRLNWKYKVAARGEVDLGKIKVDLAFVFHMGLEPADGEAAASAGAPDEVEVQSPTAVQSPKAKKRTAKLPGEYRPEDEIPLECWQFCHILWKHDFHIEHQLFSTGEYIIILVGLPYKLLVEEAHVNHTHMRLERTKGSHDFRAEMAERYAKVDGDSPFTSAQRQLLTISRMKRCAKIHPETLAMHESKLDAFDIMRRRYTAKARITAREVYNVMRAYGCYRPKAGNIFGLTVKKVATSVADNEWQSFVHPDKLANANQMTSLSGIAAKKAKKEVSWKDIGVTIKVMETFDRQAGGALEDFAGEFVIYFALHDMKRLPILREKWGNYKMLKFHTQGFFIKGKDPENVSMVSLYHPENQEKRQYSALWQPIDDIRDYFGEEVALYFAWLGLYTRSLCFPAVFGVFTSLNQWWSGSIDENPMTIPYSIFFAAWSISFLSAWKRYENELKFLWGTEGFESMEKPRPTFVGKRVVNPETDRDEVVKTGQVKRLLINAFSASLTFGFIVFTIYCSTGAAVIGDYDKRVAFEVGSAATAEDDGLEDDAYNATDGSGGGDDWSPAKELAYRIYSEHKYKGLSAMLNLIIIVVFGSTYQAIAEWLTELENHRTETEWWDSMIVKNFLFQFVNNYFVLFYFAYLKPFNIPCGEDECVVSVLSEIQVQLAVVFTGKTIQARLAEIYTPVIKAKLNESKHVRKMMEVVETAAKAALDAAEQTAQAAARTLNLDDGDSVDEDGLELTERVKGGEMNGSANGGDEEAPPQVPDGGGAEAADDEADLQGMSKKAAKREMRLRSVSKAVLASTQMGAPIELKKSDIKEWVAARAEADDNVEGEFAMETFISTFDEFNEMACRRVFIITLDYNFLHFFKKMYY